MRRQHMWSNSNALDPVRPPSASTSKSPSISERVETSRAGRVDNPHLPQRPQGGSGARGQVGAVSSESRHKRKAVERSEQAEAPAGRGRCPRMIAACQERQDDGRPLDSVRFELFAVLATSPNRRDILPILVSQNDRSPRSMEIGEISAIGTTAKPTDPVSSPAHTSPSGLGCGPRPPSGRDSNARARRRLPRLHRRGLPVLSDGVRPQLPGDPLRRAAGMDGTLALAAGRRWWVVWVCPDHLDGLTRLREFGRRQGPPER